MKFVDNEVVVLKLISGEEIITKLSNTTDGLVALKPISIIYQPREDGQTGIGFAPFMPYVDEDKPVMLNADLIFSQGTPDKPLFNEYIRVTTGLQLTTH